MVTAHFREFALEQLRRATAAAITHGAMFGTRDVRCATGSCPARRSKNPPSWIAEAIAVARRAKK